MIEVVQEIVVEPSEDGAKVRIKTEKGYFWYKIPQPFVEKLKLIL